MKSYIVAYHWPVQQLWLLGF